MRELVQKTGNHWRRCRHVLPFLIFLLFASLPACAGVPTGTALSHAAALDPAPVPADLQPASASMSWMIVLGVLGIAGGVGLMIWLPVEKTLGLAVAGSSGTALAMAIALKVAFAHPWIIYATMAVAMAGLGYSLWENFRHNPPRAVPAPPQPA